MNNTVKERVIEFVKYKKISIREFERICNLSNGYVKGIKHSILPDKMRGISLQFPELDTAWLLTGEGQMLKGVSRNESNTINGSILLEDLNVTVAPLISQYAQAGYLAEFSSDEFLNKQPKYVATQKYGEGNFVAFEVRDDSMDNDSRKAICNGDIVLGQEIAKELWTKRLIIPGVFIIVHKENGILLREITGYELEADVITCHAHNPDKVIFPDFALKLEEVLGVFGVKELKRGGF